MFGVSAGHGSCIVEHFDRFLGRAKALNGWFHRKNGDVGHDHHCPGLIGEPSGRVADDILVLGRKLRDGVGNFVGLEFGDDCDRGLRFGNRPGRMKLLIGV